MTIALNIQNVSLTLPAASGPVNILKDISLQISHGETVAIIGPSGSGKSSLISIATGLEHVTSGEVELLGQSLSGRSESELAQLRRSRVSLVFQSFHLLPTMCALDNVRTPLEIAGLADAQDRARDILDKVGLSERMDHYPGQLSGGERQRVAVARALASHPDIVFADEPTGNLDQKTGKDIADLLFDIAKDRGAALILVTHDTELAARADRQLHMSDGHLNV